MKNKLLKINKPLKNFIHKMLKIAKITQLLNTLIYYTQNGVCANTLTHRDLHSDYSIK